MSFKSITIRGVFVLMLLTPFMLFAEESQKVEKLEATTVTARKAEESAKDVPFSLTVIGGSDLENRRLKSFEDALKQTPGIEVYTFGGVDTQNMRIRGVGSIETVSADDTSVTISIDGVPQALGSATMAIMDIERVEVLKGPQGTLMGRNSEAGAINIITKKPTRHVEGYLKGEYGTENTFLTEGAVSGPVTKTISARLAAKYSGYDNQVEYYDTDEPLTKPKDSAIRASLLWEPTSKTDVHLIVGHEKILNRTGSDVLMPYDDDPEMKIPKGSYDGDKDISRITLNFDHEFSEMIFSSVSGYTNRDSESKQFTYNGLIYSKLYGLEPKGYRTMKIEQDVYSQEVRLSSKPGDRVFWVAGANYYYSDRKLSNLDAFDSFYAIAWYNSDAVKKFKTTSKAVFGETTYPVTNKIKLTAGLRYTWEKKEYDADWKASESNTNPVRAAKDSQDLSESFGTGRFSASYAITDNMNTYFTYARGYKSKGYNDWASGFINGSDSDLKYAAAKINSYEIGLKFEKPDHKAGVNFAAFFNDVEDDHLLAFDLLTRESYVENYDTKTKGIEIDGFWSVGGFTFRAGGGYTDAEIVEVPSGSSSGVKKDNKVPDSPKWNGTISVAHNYPLPSFWKMKSPSLFTSVTNRYVGKREGNAQNNFKLDSYNKLDLRMGIGSESFEFYVWGDNILDKTYDLYGWNYGKGLDGNDVLIGMPSMGRTVGVGASYYF